MRARYLAALGLAMILALPGVAEAAGGRSDKLQAIGELPASFAGQLKDELTFRDKGFVETYVDPTGDNEAGLAPDITVTTITSAAGVHSIRVQVPNEPSILSGTFFAIFFDTDRNPATGSATGSEYSIGISGNTRTIGLSRWVGSWASTAAPSLTGSWSSGPTISIAASDLGGATSFNFWEGASWSSSVSTYFDFAPDTGSWVYAPAVTPPPSAPVPPPPSPPVAPPPAPPVDVQPPNTRIVSGVAARTRSQRATFWFQASEAGTFRCKLDGRLWTSCRSPKSYGGLRPGWHTFRVAARDQAGNVDPTPAVRRWLVRKS